MRENRTGSVGGALGAYLACGGIAIGSFGPWGTEFFPYDGIANNGSLTLLAAGLAAFAVWRWTVLPRRSAAVATLTLGALCVAVAVHDMLEIRSTVGSTDDWTWLDGVGWGLGLVFVSGIALALFSISLYRRSRAVTRSSLNWRQRALMAGIGVVFSVGLASVAMSEPRRSEAGPLFLNGPGSGLSAQAVERRILALRSGTPVRSAMANLGSPELVLVGVDESVFYYGPWQLTFAGRGLTDRVRYAEPESELSIWAYDRRLGALNRKIRRLRPGVSIQAAKRRLGQPEGVEVYGTSLREDVDLWYGDLRLNFVGEKFRGAYR